MCDYQATTLSSLTHHTKSVHQGVKYPCAICGYKATTQSSLTAHFQSQHKAGNLKTHVNIVHEGIKYKCEQCDKQFKGSMTEGEIWLV